MTRPCHQTITLTSSLTFANRAFSQYRKCSKIQFCAIRDSAGTPYALWNCDGYVQKHTGSGRSAPYPIMDGKSCSQKTCFFDLTSHHLFSSLRARARAHSRCELGYRRVLRDPLFEARPDREQPNGHGGQHCRPRSSRRLVCPSGRQGNEVLTRPPRNQPRTPQARNLFTRARRVPRPTRHKTARSRSMSTLRYNLSTVRSRTGTTFIEVLLEEAVRRQELNEPVSRRADGHHSLGGQHGHIADGAIHPLLAAFRARIVPSRGSCLILLVRLDDSLTLFFLVRLCECGVPADATSTVVGHNTMKKAGHAIDDNNRNYQEQCCMGLAEVRRHARARELSPDNTTRPSILLSHNTHPRECAPNHSRNRRC